MIVSINTTTKRVKVEGTEAEKQDPDLMKKIGVLLKQVSDKINPPEIPELFINEERIDDITEEMQRVFLTEHSGDYH